MKLRLPPAQPRLCALIIALFMGFATAAEIENSSFESGLKEWRSLWTRDAGSGELALDPEIARSGKNSARIAHKGENDWSFEPSGRLPVNPGDIFDLTCWLKMSSESRGDATVCVAILDAEDHVIDWSYGARSLARPDDWRQLRSRFVVPNGVASLQPRIIGRGKATIWVDDFTLERNGRVDLAQRSNTSRFSTIQNDAIEVTLDSSNAAFTVVDRRTNRRFEQKAVRNEMLLLNATQTEKEIRVRMLHTASGLEITGLVRLDPAVAEFTVELSADGELPSPIQFPHPFLTTAREYLVVPMNEGISYPVEDKAIEPMRLIAYGGHGICMAFWGATDGAAGHAAIIESPDDAAIRIDRVQGRLAIAPEWDAQRGQFGYRRKLRYVFFQEGGHVRIAKRYRDYARGIGLLKTLSEKRVENPNADLLMGAVNVWCWDKDAVSIVKEMQAAGIDRILWSNRQSPENLRRLNEMGVLSSRYDIYQDAMNPENFRALRWIHPDWTTNAWPQDVILNARGDWQRGWGVEGKDDKMYPCGVLCDRRALDYARERIRPELATHPYRSRFIDTTTA